MKNKLLLALFIIFILGGVWILFREIYDDFRLSNVTWNEAVDPEWDLTPLTPAENKQVDTLLKNPWTYLGKGHQSFAFESEDKQYVLKFIKFTYLKPSLFAWNEDYKKDRLQRVFSGYKLAYERDKTNNGLVTLHKREFGAAPQQIHLKDRLGLSHTVNVTPLYYIIQKKAIPTRDLLKTLLAQKNYSEIQCRLLQILDMYAEMYKKGLYDADHNVLYNTGFVGDQPIRIDAGRLKSDFSMQNPAVFKDDLDKIVDERMQKWVQKLPLEQQTLLMDALHKKVAEIEQLKS